MISWPLRAASAALSVGLLLAGCGGSGEGRWQDSGNTKAKTAMDMQEAAEKADAMLDATLDAVKPPVQWAHGVTTSGSCDVSRRRTVMTVISAERRGSFLGVVERFWRAQGYEITSVHRSRKFPGIFAWTPDGFQVAAVIRGAGQAFLEVTTPCVKESEVAESTSEPNGPAYEGVYPLPRPNVRSDFWSSDEPVSKK